jgi:signal transduction histidine kinase
MPPLESDKLRVRQVLINIIYNAVKFTDHGRISIKCYQEEQWIKIEISDTGIGIKKEDLDKLFNPFIQLENNLTRRFEGSGLGLSISKKIMDMLKGTILVSSVYNAGTTFTLIFPLRFTLTI